MGKDTTGAVTALVVLRSARHCAPERYERPVKQLLQHSQGRVGRDTSHQSGADDHLLACFLPAALCIQLRYAHQCGPSPTLTVLLPESGAWE